MTSRTLGLLVAALLCAGLPVGVAGAAENDPTVEAAVEKVIPALMEKHGIPGMAISVVHPGGREILTFGLASTETQQPVTADTLFEIGSVSKTFTATLAAYAIAKGKMALTDPVSRHVSELQGSNLDRVTVLNLATHTSGGMPLQFPDAVTNDAAMIAYYRDWAPTEEPGSFRTYANPSAGLLGLAAAEALGGKFTKLMEQTLYPALGLRNTYLDVPEEEQLNYAQGYTRKDKPVRMTPGVLDKEAYGVRTTILDLTRFIEANMGRIVLEADVAKAVSDTQIAYFQLGPMTQAMIWEEYRYPVKLGDLIAGNGPDVAGKANKVKALAHPIRPDGDVWINKTGSTNGFGAYVAFVPSRQLGIVLVANKNYPNEARVTAAYSILQELDGSSVSVE